VSVKKILVSQPQPTSEKSPYYDLAQAHGVEVVFRPFVKVEGVTAREFRSSKITLSDYSAIIMTARHAVDHFFRLCQETRYTVPDTLKYFCVSQTVAHYLQKYITYRKRKIFYAESGKMQDLLTILSKHNKENYLLPMSDAHVAPDTAIDSRIHYTPVVMYRTVSNDFTPEEPFDYDMVIFFTSTGVKTYTANFPDYRDRKVVIGAMGKSTIDTLAEVGLPLDITVTPEHPSMAAAISNYLKKNK